MDQRDAKRRYQRLVIVCCLMVIIFPLLTLLERAFALVFWLLLPCAAIAALYFATKISEVRRQRARGR